MSSLDDWMERVERRLRDVEGDVASLKLRFGSLESWRDGAFEPATKTMIVEVVDRKAIEDAMKIGEALSDMKKDLVEGAREARGVRESAHGLRRIASPRDDTGAHQLPEKAKR